MNASSNPFSLQGKRILVTGSSSGIGKAIAITCAYMGGTIICTGRNHSRLSQTLNELKTISCAEHIAVEADLLKSNEREVLVAALGGNSLDGVVHSAGISRLSPVRMLTEAHLHEVQSINVDAPMLLTQLLLKKKLIASDASMVFIASIAAHIGVPGVAAYSGTKAALLAMTRCLAMEVVKHRIRVNCLSPSLVETPLFEAATSVVGSMEQERLNHPLGFGVPEDIANATVFFLSAASRWVTGTTLIMDGGMTVR